MKKLILVLLFVPLISFGQNFTFYELIELFDLRSSESLMYKKGLRNIKVSKMYTYKEITRTADCELDPDGKLCDWRCRTVDEVIRSEYEKSSIDFKNYIFIKSQRSKFADGYNSETKTAYSFIDIFYSEESDNGNCNNSFTFGSPPIYTLSIDIQFNDKSDFEYLKKSILENAEYQKTVDLYNTVPEAKFLFLDKKRDRNIFFSLSEYDDSGIIEMNVGWI
tara:strand:- start:941 stop:1603 length:663 start_codon:yes stop_codon:yes gene_type:complete